MSRLKSYTALDELITLELGLSRTRRSAMGLGRVKKRCCMTRTGAGYRNPINLGKVYGHSTRTHPDAMSGLFHAPHEPQRPAPAPRITPAPPPAVVSSRRC